MKTVRLLVLFLATAGLSLVSLAQEAATAQPADTLNSAMLESLVPARFAPPTTPNLSSTAPAPTPNLLVRAATPTIPAQRKFFDRQQLIAFYVHSGVRLADTINTCHALAHGGVEDWIPAQSCAGVAGWQVGSVGLTLAVGWLFYKTGHHKLERITPWVGTSASAAGLTKSIFNLR